MPFIYSTMTAGVDYCFYDMTGAGDTPSLKKTIPINGGTGLANKNLITPQGVVTEVTDEELAMLESNPTYCLHRDNGFLRVDSKKIAIEKAIVDLKEEDGSSPMTPEKFKKLKNAAQPKKD